MLLYARCVVSPMAAPAPWEKRAVRVGVKVQLCVSHQSCWLKCRNINVVKPVSVSPASPHTGALIADVFRQMWLREKQLRLMNIHQC